MQPPGAELPVTFAGLCTTVLNPDTLSAPQAAPVTLKAAFLQPLGGEPPKPYVALSPNSA
jgi:hypothetical protein